jgi:hypothetical protein
MNGRYILHGQTPVPCEDLLKWADWLETANRHVRDETVCDHRVSTVFLGLDHSFAEGPPILFETMVFCKHEPACDLDNEEERFATWADAEAGHAAMVSRVRSHVEPLDVKSTGEV